jgi:hypothetical protein
MLKAVGRREGFLPLLVEGDLNNKEIVAVASSVADVTVLP